MQSEYEIRRGRYTFKTTSNAEHSYGGIDPVKSTPCYRFPSFVLAWYKTYTQMLG